MIDGKPVYRLRTTKFGDAQLGREIIVQNFFVHRFIVHKFTVHNFC